MSNKEQIIELSWNINDLLLQYVAIHDDIFKTSIRHVIPIPRIFKTINFGTHLKNIENIITELENYDSKIKSFIQNINEQEQKYLDLLSKYVGTLIKTVGHLKIIVNALYIKSQSFVNSNYNWKDYKNDLAKYEQLVQDYMVVGDHLNELFEKIK